jgi:hypothetical protein
MIRKVETCSGFQNKHVIIEFVPIVIEANLTFINV